MSVVHGTREGSGEIDATDDSRDKEKYSVFFCMSCHFFSRRCFLSVPVCLFLTHSRVVCMWPIFLDPGKIQEMIYNIQHITHMLINFVECVAQFFLIKNNNSSNSSTIYDIHGKCYYYQVSWCRKPGCACVIRKVELISFRSFFLFFFSQLFSILLSPFHHSWNNQLLFIQHHELTSLLKFHPRHETCRFPCLQALALIFFFSVPLTGMYTGGNCKKIRIIYNFYEKTFPTKVYTEKSFQQITIISGNNHHLDIISLIMIFFSWNKAWVAM